MDEAVLHARGLLALTRIVLNKLGLEAALKPELGLVPDHGPLERYRRQEWLGFLAPEVHKGFILSLYPVLAGKYGVETAQPKPEERLVRIDQQLAGRDHLIGDTYTVADAYLSATGPVGRRRGWSLSTGRTFTSTG